LSGVDQDLVRRSLEGEESAFNEIINRYKRGVYTLIIRMVGRPEEADDLCQETFVRLYSSLSSYDPRYKFSSWLFKIANNLTIDFLRRQRPEVASLDDTVDTGDDTLAIQVKDKGMDPLGRVESMELYAKIKEAIGNLPVDYRRVILLRHLEDMSYEEIAGVTGLPLGTVKTLLFRGRRLLRKRLRTVRDEPGI